MQNNNKQFKQLNQEQRVEIYALLQAGLSYRKIAKEIGVSHTTISREIKRNSTEYRRGKKVYKPLKAEEKRLKRRRKANRKHIIFLNNYPLYFKCKKLIMDKTKDWSPDSIINRLKIEGWNVPTTTTFYRFIHKYTDRWRFLRYKKKGYKKSKYKYSNNEKIKGIKKIDERPIEANERIRIGDWEIDTIVSNKKVKGGLFTAVDRKSRYTLISKVGNFKSKVLLSCMLRLFKNEVIITLTSDNGGEFAKLKKLEKKLKIDCYTAHPYASYERGTNERTNGLIRVYLPKGVDICSYSDQYIKEIQNKLNHKPRKCLNYRTPYEVYHGINLILTK